MLTLLNNARTLDMHATAPKKAAVKSVIDQVTQKLDGSLIELRDRAMISVAFNAGGRRRSEITDMQFKDIVEATDTYYAIEIRGMKNQTYADEVLTVTVRGKARAHLEAWIAGADIHGGFLFRGLTPHKHKVKPEGLTGGQFWRIVKKRFLEAGINNTEMFSPHSFRSGFVTEQGKRKKNVYDGMAQTGHKSEEQYRKYYQAGAATQNEANDFDD